MTGKDKTFYNLEPTVIKGLKDGNSRDVSHVIYSYAIRNAGNPELYKAFDQWLTEVDAQTLDYPSLFNIFYFMLFRESKDEAMW